MERNTDRLLNNLTAAAAARFVRKAAERTGLVTTDARKAFETLAAQRGESFARGLVVASY